MDDGERSTGATNDYRQRFARGPDGRSPFPQADGTGEEPIWVDDSNEVEEEEKKRIHEGLYAILNLPTTATPSQIRDRYRQLAILFHPDKQPTSTNDGNSPSLSVTANPQEQHPYLEDLPRPRSRKEAAEIQFGEIQRAYEVLMDPQRRAVYDLLGEEGLKTSWEVGKKNMSADEVRQIGSWGSASVHGCGYPFS